MKDKVRFGLMGYGKVANLYVQALASSARGELVSVCGRNAERRDNFAARWKIASRATAEEMVRKDSADAVIITTPHPRHRDGALEAFAAGAHVLVEKPMALTGAECDDIIAASKKAGKCLSVVSQRRWFPACVRVKEAIAAGKLGRPALAQLTILGWRDKAYYDSDPWRGKWSTEGGGILINQAPHQIDLLHWFMGPFREIQGFWDNFNHPYIEVEDSAVAAIRFKSGALGSVLVSNSQKPGIYAKVHVHGDAAYSAGVQTDGGAMFIAGMSGAVEPPLNDLWTIEGEQGLLDKFRKEDEAFFKELEARDSAITHFFTCQLDDFCGAIRDGRPPAVSGEDGRETVRFIEAVLKTGSPAGFNTRNRGGAA
ncbi:MAG: Gfo/Idh/MocA family oxidoreductase [Spirochaetaceae bacterium]|jgi:predicted dehydrogenase|nr:Gfo/Idh/MocA family oxidoreductase [Spirochaetaceae bacterium]